jgi:ribosomal protein L11 methyltransferase
MLLFFFRQFNSKIYIVEYLEFKFKVSPLQPWKDLLEAELGEVGFESFADTAEGVDAYVQEENFNEEDFNNISVLSNGLCEIVFEKNKVIPKNWNEEWEKNFSPIDVDGRCVIRAPFHEATNADYEIIIEPKMSFGTGHHQTTHLMISYILDMDVKGQSVMDMGCGTGILAILAAQKGATNIDAIDIDEWAFENTMENAERNNVGFIKGAKGDASLLKGDENYDLFIANINRNILINDMSTYAKSIKVGGQLLLSGFYETDIDQLVSETEKHGFELQEKRNKETWAALRFKKLN